MDKSQCSDLRTRINTILEEAKNRRKSITIKPIQQDEEAYLIEIDGRKYQVGSIVTEEGEMLNFSILVPVFPRPLLEEFPFWINQYRIKSIKRNNNLYQEVFIINEESMK